MKAGDSLVAVGRVAGPYGIKGWVRITSFTEPGENVFAYAPWVLRDQHGRRDSSTIGVLESKMHGKGWVAKLDGVQDRDAAEALKGLEIVIDRSRLPEPDEGHYYWADLEGLQACQRDGRVLGHVDHMLETGSADVMVIVGSGADERVLIPFIMNETVIAVDLEGGTIQVDWDQAD